MAYRTWLDSYRTREEGDRNERVANSADTRGAVEPGPAEPAAADNATVALATETAGA